MREKNHMRKEYRDIQQIPYLYRPLESQQPVRKISLFSYCQAEELNNHC